MTVGELESPILETPETEGGAAEQTGPLTRAMTVALIPVVLSIDGTRGVTRGALKLTKRAWRQLSHVRAVVLRIVARLVAGFLDLATSLRPVTRRIREVLRILLSVARLGWNGARGVWRRVVLALRVLARALLTGIRAAWQRLRVVVAVLFRSLVTLLTPPVRRFRVFLRLLLRIVAAPLHRSLLALSVVAARIGARLRRMVDYLLNLDQRFLAGIRTVARKARRLIHRCTGPLRALFGSAQRRLGQIRAFVHSGVAPARLAVMAVWLRGVRHVKLAGRVARVLAAAPFRRLAVPVRFAERGWRASRAGARKVRARVRARLMAARTAISSARRNARRR